MITARLLKLNPYDGHKKHGFEGKMARIVKRGGLYWLWMYRAPQKKRVKLFIQDNAVFEVNGKHYLWDANVGLVDFKTV